MAEKRSWEKKFQHSISTGVTLVDFDAAWCKPCRAQARIIKAIAEDYQGTVKVKTLNIDDNRDIAFKIGIQSIPTVLIYKDGIELKRFIGLQTTETLNTALRDAMDQPALPPHQKNK